MKKMQDAPAWPDVIARLRMDRAGAEAEVLAAARDSGSAALPATFGDPDAVVRLAEADAREAAAMRRVRQLDAAIVDAEGQHRAAQQAEADARTAERRVALVEASGEMVARAAAVDAAARALAAAMGAYDGQLTVLTRLGLDASKHSRLRNKTMIAGGLHLAGLSGRVPLASCSPHHRKTLRDWAGQMLGDLLEAPVQRAGLPAKPIMTEAAA